MDWTKYLRKHSYTIVSLLLILNIPGSYSEENKDVDKSYKDALAIYGEGQFPSADDEPKSNDRRSAAHDTDTWAQLSDINQVAELLRHGTKRNSDQVSKFGWGKRSLNNKRMFKRTGGSKRQPNENGWGGGYGAEKRQNANAWGGAYGTEKRQNQNAWGGGYGLEESTDKRGSLNHNAWGGAYGENAEKRLNANGWGGGYGSDTEKRQNANAWGGAYGETR
ncbi:uncharacterized protein LOC141913127 [Tubulanus polymorphus]|uniref:uncharacterized protein LOC141913127 n=1 Tax=Tubulanus polymorphus TaxID=672921 RepID=UPI003DA3889D